MWLKVDDFKDLVKNEWESYDVIGSLSFIFAANLEALKEEQVLW